MISLLRVVQTQEGKASPPLADPGKLEGVINLLCHCLGDKNLQEALIAGKVQKLLSLKNKTTIYKFLMVTYFMSHSVS